MASTLRVTAEHRTGAGSAGFGVTDVLLLCMALIWGVNYAVVKFGAAQLAPLSFNSARIALASAVLVAIVVASRRAWPGGRDLLVLLALGALGNGLYQILFIEGIARTRAGDAALLIAASPALMAIGGWMRGTERTGPRGMAGIALSLLGMAFVVFGDAGMRTSGSAPLLGDAFILLSALCWAVYTVLLKPYTERVDGMTLSAVTMVGGLIPMLLVSAPAIAGTPWGAVSVGGWLAVAYSGLFALVLAYLFWYRGVKTLGPTRSAMYSNLQPIIAIAVAWATLGETPHLPQIAGTACIMTGLLLTRLPGSVREAAHG